MAYTAKFWKLRSRIAGDGLHVRAVMVAGVAANTNIAIAGLKLDAQILGVIDLTTPADLGADVSLVSAGSFQLNVTSATKNLLVVYAQSR